MKALMLALVLLTGNMDREFWCNTLYRIVEPVLSAMAEGRLHEKMDIEVSPYWGSTDRDVAYMEAFGRTMVGLSPWLALPDDDTPEGVQRKHLRELALKCYANAVNPHSKDYLLWRTEGQPLVDAAFIAESFLRAYDALWVPLDAKTKQRYFEEFTMLRRVDPPYNNWLLFNSTIEAFLAKAGGPYDKFRVSMATNKMQEWYVGDGWYSDGEEFHFDYYNSFVIQPMYIETMQTMAECGKADYEDELPAALEHCRRMAIILERFIAADGSFPVFGRSCVYRLCAMQPLALMALYDMLPDELSRGQVRAALTATMHRMFDSDANFRPDGFLYLGWNGHQPGMSDGYSNTGSTYLTTAAFLPLGLPADHPFWTCDPEPWTQVKAWNGEDFPKDSAWD